MTERFVHDQNMRRYALMLSEETDPKRRQLLERLLSEERANVPQPREADSDHAPR